jgi:hypothetical protein
MANETDRMFNSIAKKRGAEANRDLKNVKSTFKAKLVPFSKMGKH